jgi:hypothetical protein
MFKASEIDHVLSIRELSCHCSAISITAAPTRNLRVDVSPIDVNHRESKVGRHSFCSRNRSVYLH